MPGFERRILIVEDDPFISSLLLDALSSKGFAARRAENAVSAKRLVKSFDPDVAIVDIHLGRGPNGIDFIQVLRKTRPEIAAVLLSKHADSESAGLAGVRIPEGVGYLRKSLVHDTDALVESIDAVIKGRAEGLRQDLGNKGDLDLLTKTQREILHLMALGLSNKEIAKRRGVTPSSVEQRATEIYKALDIPQNESVMPRVEAVRRYIRISGIPEDLSRQ